MKLPTSVKQLNAAIENTFLVIELCRGYIDFPLQIVADESKLEYTKRITPMSLALHGFEEVCCKELWFAILSAVNTFEIEDQSTILFVRSKFLWDADKSLVRGRLAFWDESKNKILRNNRIWQPISGKPRDALEEE